jgi:putative chitinase
MKLTFEQIKRMAKRAPNAANAGSVLSALAAHGTKFGLDQPHRVAQFLAQIMHESLDFRHDREVWGPTPAQARYDTRTDLGNTPARDGDGKLFMGRTSMQVTGRANTIAFRDWCRKFIDPKTPDFEANPDLMNTDPWEGLAPLWCWDTRKLNRYADQGDAEMITKRINGGLNGFADRLDRLARCSLVLLGYAATDVKGFQRDAELTPVDGDAGPRTRAALHQSLLKRTKTPSRDVQAAPVVVEKPVAVAPAAIDAPVSRTTGFWERIVTIAGSLGLGGASWLGDWRVVVAIAAGLIVVAAFGLVFHGRIVAAVKRIKAEIEA